MSQELICTIGTVVVYILGSGLAIGVIYLLINSVVWFAEVNNSLAHYSDYNKKDRDKWLSLEVQIDSLRRKNQELERSHCTIYRRIGSIVDCLPKKSLDKLQTLAKEVVE